MTKAKLVHEAPEIEIPASDTAAEVQQLPSEAQAEAAVEPVAPPQDLAAEAQGEGPATPAAEISNMRAADPSGAVVDQDEPQAEGTTDLVDIQTRAFPGFMLTYGGTARRKAWAPGFFVSASAAGGRGGQKMKLFTSGNRGGQTEWRPANIADDLLADDWEMTLTQAQLDAAFAAQNAPV